MNNNPLYNLIYDSIEKIDKVDIKEEDKNQNIRKIKESNNIFKNCSQNEQE